MKSLTRKQALVSMLTLFWGVFATAHYGLYGHGVWLGILFGCTVVATIFTAISGYIEEINGGRGNWDAELSLMYGVRVAMTIVSALIGAYVLCLAGIRLFV